MKMIQKAQKARFLDLTPEHVLVLADKVKEEQGVGLTPVDPWGPVQLAHLDYCPPELEAAFMEVFPHAVARPRLWEDAPACPEVVLFEAAALVAALMAFGVDPDAGHVYRFDPRSYVWARPE